MARGHGYGETVGLDIGGGVCLMAAGLKETDS